MFERLAVWADAHIASSPELALIGFGVSVIAAIYVIWSALAGLAAVIGAASNSAKVRAAIRDKTPGFRILVAKTKSGGATRFTRAALHDHLERFSFGAPFRLVPAGRLPTSTQERAVKAARGRLARSGADMIVWSERMSGRPDGLRVRGLSRGGGVSPAEASVFTLFFTGRRDQWTDDQARAVAYRLAKRLQPSLSQPEGFRPERVKEIALELDGLLTSKTAFSNEIIGELEDDFCAGALHAAEAGGDYSLIDKVVDRRNTRLNSGDGKGSEFIQARLDLGRALLAKAEQLFDPLLVREGMEHLDAVISSLRGDGAIRRAQQASDAVTKGKGLLETRKRFSLNFAG